ncbi:hypothetical protein FSBG_00032 [Fusobacterium gonidiaformans 3-1-5R]|uniref:Uncharacterized protein n=2 Tax=Fusobacterium TaxID=848 RepID=E5BEK4_9FUSO|nr:MULTISPECIES: hypothetical protein [Fusobacterium]AVQ16925.1 hypothetical protein C4N16_05020 [Fusobacterium gonidiaformans ATCC 25563]EFS20535.1 hypothetical protein FSBG_00032 [Fusobacterium gonidiaformans 3-1-5R]EFS28766.2 hypothetical protein FGAG_01087 [Fusobacterium gonidiaformans ATCC 25563]KXA13882.1 hypothetical protein HMPREF3206_01191 [Fusobacterium equinum]
MTRYRKLAYALLFSFCCFFSTSLFLHSNKVTLQFGEKAEKNIVLLVPQTSGTSHIAVLTQGKSGISILENYSTEYFPDLPKKTSYLFVNFFKEKKVIIKCKYQCVIQTILTIFPKRVLRN